MPDADISMALPAVLFSAVGTAGQRCTSLRRLYLHRSIADSFLERLIKAYSTVRIGDPLDSTTLQGPLHTSAAVDMYNNAISKLRSSGAEVLAGGTPYKHDQAALEGGNYVLPTLVRPRSADTTQDIWRKETFAPVLNVAVFDELEEAIEMNNKVPQGLSSSLWTRDIRNIGKWLGPAGSDAGIVNVSSPMIYLDERDTEHSFRSMSVPQERRSAQRSAATR